MAGEGRVAGPHSAGLAGSRQEAAVRQSGRLAARGFYCHGRSLRRLYCLHQGALPIAAALFHRLSGGDETRRRLADCLEIVSLRCEAIAHPILRHSRRRRSGHIGPPQESRTVEATFQIFLILLAVLAGTALLARRIDVAPAILLLLAGIALAFVPGMPSLELPPELVLLLVLPP